MKLAGSFRSTVAVNNRKVLRLLAFALFTATLTAKAFASGGSCDPTTFVPSMEVCDDPSKQWYEICNCTSWDSSTGYSDCTIINGCY